MATQCPITREQFTEKAKPLTVVIDGKSYELAPDEFKSDSLGWKLNEKGHVEIDGVRCKVQIGLNITIVGSKRLD